jgi:hypothetical protein
VAAGGDRVGDGLRHLSLTEPCLPSTGEGAHEVIKRRTDIHGLNLGTGCDTPSGPTLYPALARVSGLQFGARATVLVATRAQNP